MSLGGVYIGMPKDALIAMYGQPVSVDINILKYGRSGTTFDIYCGDVVGSITVSGNNGVSTPAGVKVGTTYEDVLRLQGTPTCDLFRDASYNSVSYESEDGTRELYFYFKMEKLKKLN